MLATYRHGALGQVTTIGLPIRMDGYQPAYRPAPLLDGDRAVILAAAGYAEEEVERLRRLGAFGHA